MMISQALPALVTKLPKLELVALDEDASQLHWSIRLNNVIVGTIAVQLQASEEIDAPTLVLVVDSTDQESSAVYSASLAAVLKYLYQSTSYPTIYARHLVDDDNMAKLLLKAGFKRDGKPYTADDKLCYQNLYLAND